MLGAQKKQSGLLLVTCSEASTIRKNLQGIRRLRLLPVYCHNGLDRAVSVSGVIPYPADYLKKPRHINSDAGRPRLGILPWWTEPAERCCI